MDPQRTLGEKLDRLFASLAAGDCVRVLEIACGKGAGTAAVYRHLMARQPGGAARLFCLDRDLGSLREARRRVANAGCPRVSLLGADLYRLPLPASSFDYAVAFNVFHAADKRRFAHELWRVLKPGGVLLTCDRVPDLLAVPRLAMILDRERLAMLGRGPLEPAAPHS